MNREDILRYIADVLQEFGDNRLLHYRDYLRVLLTVPETQIAVRYLRPREDIPSQVNDDGVVYVYVLKGKMYSHIDNAVAFTEAGSGVLIPAGTRHYIANGDTTKSLQLLVYTSPPRWPANYIEYRQADHK